MTHRNQHNWTWLPELGSDYSYCELCGKVMVNKSGKVISWKEALKLRVEELRTYLAQADDRERSYIDTINWLKQQLKDNNTVLD